MNFSQRMILSMLAVLLLFALINGLLVYSMINKSDTESVYEFQKMMQQNEEISTDSFNEYSKFFSEKFRDSRIKLIGNLFGIMLVSFLIGLFLIFKQMDSFIVPLRSLSDYIHRLASEGIHFEDFNINSSSQIELKSLAKDLNSMVHNVGSLIENVRISADRVSDLSGACKDMLDIVEFDVKLGGQRTTEMAFSSEEVVDNVKGMAEGIEEINVNLDGLKKLTSRVTENTTDIKSSVSQMSESMRELNEKSRNVQNNAISVTQAVNDIELASTEEFSRINSISEFAVNLLEELGKMSVQTSELRKAATRGDVNVLCEIAEALYNNMISVQIQLTNLQDNQIAPLEHVLEERKNLSQEMSSDTSELNDSVGGIVDRIAEINLSSQYINSSVKFVSNDINKAYRNLEEIVEATDSMNEHAKQATNRMDDFSLQIKKVKDAHFAIENTLKEAKDSMYSLNELSSKLRKVVDNLVRLDNKSQAGI